MRRAPSRGCRCRGARTVGCMAMQHKLPAGRTKSLTTAHLSAQMLPMYVSEGELVCGDVSLVS